MFVLQYSLSACKAYAPRFLTVTYLTKKQVWTINLLFSHRHEKKTNMRTSGGFVFNSRNVKFFLSMREKPALSNETFETISNNDIF